MQAASASSCIPNRVGYGHAVLCARGFVRQLPHCGTVGDQRIAGSQDPYRIDSRAVSGGPWPARRTLSLLPPRSPNSPGASHAHLQRPRAEEWAPHSPASCSAPRASPPLSNRTSPARTSASTECAWKSRWCGAGSAGRRRRGRIHDSGGGRFAAAQSPLAAGFERPILAPAGASCDRSELSSKIGAAEAGTEIPARGCRIPYIWAAPTLSDVGEVRIRVPV